MNKYILLSMASSCLLFIAACSGTGSSAVESQPVGVPVVPPVLPPVTNVDERIFYVSPAGVDDADLGSEAQPWKTIQYGVDNLSPGDKLVVMAGIYEQRVALSGVGDSGTESLPIIIEAESGAIIDGTNLVPDGQDALMKLDNVNHVKIYGFELRNFKTSDGFIINDSPIGLLITGSSSNIDVSNNVIHHIENNSACHQSDNCGPSANGIAVFGNTVDGISNLNFSNNEIYNCKTSSSEVFVLNGNVNGFSVSGNYVHNNNNIGLDFIGFENICPRCSDNQNQARNGIVSENRVIDNSTSNLGGNPWYGEERSAGGIYIDGGRNIIIDRNTISGNDLGIEISSEASEKFTINVLVTNNIIYENNEVGISLGGYNSNANESGGGSVARIGVHNNTFYKNQGWGTDIVVQYRVFDTQFTNNAIYSVGDVSEGVGFNEPNNQQENEIAWSHNLWWGEGEKDGVPNDVTNSVSMDPLFSNAADADFSPLPTSPLINAGVLSAFTNDWTASFWNDINPPNGVVNTNGEKDNLGKARIFETIDIGAIEKQ